MSYDEVSAGSMASRGYMKLVAGSKTESNSDSHLRSQLTYRYNSPLTVSLDYNFTHNFSLGADSLPFNAAL